MLTQLVLKRRHTDTEARGLDLHGTPLDAPIAVRTPALMLGLRAINAGFNTQVFTDFLDQVLPDVPDVVGF
jgi:hypothetical protein